MWSSVEARAVRIKGSHQEENFEDDISIDVSKDRTLDVEKQKV